MTNPTTTAPLIARLTLHEVGAKGVTDNALVGVLPSDLDRLEALARAGLEAMERDAKHAALVDAAVRAERYYNTSTCEVGDNDPAFDRLMTNLHFALQDYDFPDPATPADSSAREKEAQHE